MQSTMNLFPQIIPPARAAFIARAYQAEAKAEVIKGFTGNRLGNTFTKQLVVLATGLGKTPLFADVAKWVMETQHGRVLILAHREELLEQAEDKTRWVVGEQAAIGWEQGARWANPKADQIVLASVPTLGRAVTAIDASEYDGITGAMVKFTRPNDRLSRFPRDHFKLIIIDEAHHATASTYQNILNYFENAWVLGVTATSKRGDKDSLHDVFDRVAFKMDIVEGTKKGHLNPITCHRVKSTTSLDGLKTTAGDFNIAALANRVNNAERNSLVVRTYLEKFAGSQAIVFATDLDHARAIDQEFETKGVASYAITGDMDKNERREAIRRFKSGEIQILTNFGVLTEGFDYDLLGTIINARPTQSMLLLTQIAGRLTRKHVDKVLANFVEIVDGHSEKTATCAQIFDFKQKFEANGHDFLDCIQLAEKCEAEKDYFNPWVCLSYQEIVDRFARATDQNPFGNDRVVQGPAEQDVEQSDRFDSRYRYYSCGGGAYKLVHNDRDTRQKYVCRIEPDGMGGHLATISQTQDRETKRLYQFQERTTLAAAKRIEDTIMARFKHFDILLNIGAAWRKRAATEPATEKQMFMIRKFKLERGRTDISKADAIEILSKFFNKA